jgi:hypothetical protein
MGKWSDLPLDLVECVEEYLDFLEKVRIRAVCTSWNSYLHAVPKLISEDLPWLLLEDSTKGASLYSVHEAKFYPLNLPEVKNKVFKGSSHGWIITLDDENSNHIDDIYAINPLTRVAVKLPPRSSFPDIQDFNRNRLGHEYIMKHYSELDPKLELGLGIMRHHDKPEPESEPGQNYAGIHFHGFGKGRVSHYLTHKVVLSSSPSNDDCMAVAVYGECSRVAWCWPHHKRWTSFKKCYGNGRGVQDVLFHNGHLHVLYGDGMLEIYESIDPEEVVRQVHVKDPPSLGPPIYLAACPNYGLIIAKRLFKHFDLRDGVCDICTTWIFLYKLAQESKTLVEVEGLGENILFIGLNMSSLIPVSDDFKALGYKRNCIYFTDYFAFLFCRKEIQDDSDMAVIDLDEPVKDTLPGFKDEPEVFWPPPIWVTPSAT